MMKDLSTMVAGRIQLSFHGMWPLE
jgi:hypothetical protein